ncbi:hypothetical protein DFS34DRAFT_262386 [Phlyctochytrium arcticum]|nr:hypothetical protein DFS34DRAFT_262386 [Phlyctochytrium arcticum]
MRRQSLPTRGTYGWPISAEIFMATTTRAVSAERLGGKNTWQPTLFGSGSFCSRTSICVPPIRLIMKANHDLILEVHPTNCLSRSKAQNTCFRHPGRLPNLQKSTANQSREQDRIKQFWAKDDSTYVKKVDAFFGSAEAGAVGTLNVQKASDNQMRIAVNQNFDKVPHHEMSWSHITEKYAPNPPEEYICLWPVEEQRLQVLYHLQNAKVVLGRVERRKFWALA